MNNDMNILSIRWNSVSSMPVYMIDRILYVDFNVKVANIKIIKRTNIKLDVYIG